MSKLDIKNEMRALDNKDRAYYDNLDTEEQKKFSPYVLSRWAASVDGPADLQEWYLRATNERVNINFFDVSTTKHKKLQWLLCTTVSPNLGTHYHYWVTTKKANKLSPATKLLALLYPKLKKDELELMLEINSIDEIKEQARLHGYDEKDIKQLLK